MLSGKLALVTGAHGGIGLEVSKLFAQQGASVIMVDLNEKVKNIVNGLHKSNDALHSAFVCDVSKSDQVNELFNNIKQQYPTLKSPNIVVNCAGFLKISPFLTLSEEDFDKMVAVHLKGTFLVSQTAAKALVSDYENAKIGATDTYASIINFSSLAATRGFENCSHYSAAKAGIESLTRAMAKSLAKYKIRCNCVAPGFIDTPMLREFFEHDPAASERAINATPLGRFGRADEVAQSCLFLASNMSSFITGESVGIRGGVYY